MVKIIKKTRVKKTQKNTVKNNYSIKTRKRDKKLPSMSREIKNIKDGLPKGKSSSNMPRVFRHLSSIPSTRKTKNSKNKNKKSHHSQSIPKSLSVFPLHPSQNKKFINPNKNMNKNNNSCFGKYYSNNTKKNKLNKKTEKSKKVFVDIYKYKLKQNEYFEFKEVLNFIKNDLGIDIDPKNIKIKNKDEFKSKLNDMFKNFILIYFNKILITENNLKKILEFLSKFIIFDSEQIIKLLNDKCQPKTINEDISLEQFFKPFLTITEKDKNN